LALLPGRHVVAGGAGCTVALWYGVVALWYGVVALWYGVVALWYGVVALWGPRGTGAEGVAGL
ncbi:MAG: hypothetical protein OEW29_07060, partial [Acidimicrobiia bacterium]|nr:hypothetical protein [Acidimicrobiia bacterium]